MRLVLLELRKSMGSLLTSVSVRPSLLSESCVGRDRQSWPIPLLDHLQASSGVRIMFARLTDRISTKTVEGFARAYSTVEYEIRASLSSCTLAF